MPSLVGFTLYRGLTADSIRAALRAQRRALRHYPHLKSTSLKAGKSQLEVWGHPDLDECLYAEPDGTIAALVGFPHEKVTWPEAARQLFGSQPADTLRIPWDGQVVLLRISEGGRVWTLWNDWMGSVPVYYARAGDGWILSTLEPVVVAAAGFGCKDIFPPALASLFVNGFYISDWTLFRGMQVVPSDCCAQWEDGEFLCKKLWTVKPSEERWERGWDDLVEEMNDTVRQAIGRALGIRSRWILPLSSGMDSRLIAAVGSEMGINFRAYTWGESNATDVVYGRKIAECLDIPWKHVELGREYLLKYTGPWTDLFGTAMHPHGMYQMQFYGNFSPEADDLFVSGYLGDIISGDDNTMLVTLHSADDNYQVLSDSYVHWTAEEARSLFKFPLDEALSENKRALKRILEDTPGSFFQKAQLLNLQTRQCRFIGFQTILADYQSGAVAPYLSRAYARFCLSLPRSAYNRRLMADVFRRYYARLAAIPGSYAQDPYLLTGRYLLRRRLSRRLPPILRRGPLAGTDRVPLTMDLGCVKAYGWESLWPIREKWDRLEEWIRMDQASGAFEAVMNGKQDIRLVKKLQAVQSLAYLLLKEDPVREEIV